ncbi:spike base protein, RCAP_Rcc01079 family [Devosia sp.]|uniref:spike base protein, RCAP_Rcc01079 family n=1 Tax=Devosia sp. TaxID=1871048 RepID=UPI003A93F5A4
MQDRYSSRAAGSDGPATHGFAITPDDGSDLAETTRAIYVGTAGDLVAVLTSGAELTFASVPSGSVLPVRADRIRATATSAGDLIGLV